MRKSSPCSLIILLALSSLLLSGCLFIAPTFTKEKVAESIVNLCKKEYNIEPKVWLDGETVWIYMPMPRLITKEKELSWDTETMEKINKTLMIASRVVLSMKPRPHFIAVVASDTQEYGLDYTIITWIPDIVKFQLQLISRDEFLRRTLMKVEQNPAAISDVEGAHIQRADIKIKDFLAEQITKRIISKFSMEPALKDYFKVDQVETVAKNGIFTVSAAIKQVKPLPEGKNLDIQKEIARISDYVINQYEVRDFLSLEIKDIETKEERSFTRLDLKKFLLR